jgi:predicted membrane-bound spermidine synthase
MDATTHAPAGEADATPAGAAGGAAMLALSARAGFAVVTAALLLAEIALTRLFSGTIGYYFAFMSISVAMLGLGAGSLWVTLRREGPSGPYVRSAGAALGLGASGAISTLVYLAYYPAMGNVGLAGQLAYVGLFGALFLPFLFGGVLVATVFEAGRASFSKLYAIDLAGASVGCVAAVFLLDRVPAPAAMLVISALAALAAPLFLAAAGRHTQAIAASALVLGASLAGGLALKGSPLFEARVIRNQVQRELVLDRWNDFSRVVVRRGDFYTWGLSETYPKKQERQFDLLIEGVAGTQIQRFDGRDARSLDFFDYDVSSLAHLVRPKGSTLVLGVGAGFDVLMAKHFGKAPVVGVEVNPLVADIVNGEYGDYSGRPYHQPDVTVHIENARTFVKRDTQQYDVVTVTWVDSGAATGAGAFALTENYLYTVDAFRDYLARLKDDGVLAFMRARYSPEYDAIKGIGIAVEALRQLGVNDPGRHIVVTSVSSPHFGNRELTHVMVRKVPFTPEELATIDEARARLHFFDLYTPGRNGPNAPIARLINDADRAAVYASFPFDMEPNGDDRPFYFFLRELDGRPATHDVVILRNAMITIFVLIGAFLAVPLALLLRRGVRGPSGLAAPTAYFSLLGLGFMLVEMKLLQQSVLVVGNPTLSLAAVLASLLLSTGVGALLAGRLAHHPARARLVPAFFGALLVVLLIALACAEPLANALTALPMAARTAGLVLAIAPLGLLLGCPLPLGMAALGGAEGTATERGLVAWCWGINGMFGVAGSAVAMYVAIHIGLRNAFLCGVICYLAAAALYLLRFGKGALRAQAA